MATRRVFCVENTGGFRDVGGGRRLDFSNRATVMCLRRISVLIAIVLAGCAVFDRTGDPPPLVEEEPAGDQQYVVVEGGLEGPATRGDWDAALADPHVRCGLDDVAHGDIGDTHRDGVPDSGWDTEQVDDTNRCGDDYETLLFRLTNCERRARDLPPLTCDERLVWAGRDHSRDMIDRNYFSHRTPEGTSPGQRLSERGVEWRTSSENIAMAPTMALAHSGWMRSDGHRQNILRREVEYIGIGVIRSPHGYVMTSLFVGGFD